MRFTEEEILGAASPEGLADLFGKLGFEAGGFKIRVGELAAWGFRPPTRRLLQSLRVLREQSGFRILLATLREPPTTAAVRALVSDRHLHDLSARELIAVTGPGFQELVLAIRRHGSDGPPSRLLIRFDELYPADLEALAELRVDGNRESSTEIALRFEEVLDRERVTWRFFRKFKTVLETLKSHVSGLPESLPDRQAALDRFCLVTLDRLIFLYFIQKKGWLDGNRRFLPELFSRSRKEGRPFFELLQVLFFRVLNTPRRQRDGEARGLGRFPYLNGGLFEPDPVERSHGGLRIEDGAFRIAFDELLEKYRFTVSEDPELDHGSGIDPEMLGKVFENLMDLNERGASGSFYTPRPMVARMVSQSLMAFLTEGESLTTAQARKLLLEESTSGIDDSACRQTLSRVESIRVLDPASGSGAFLLGALSQLEKLQITLRTRLGVEPEPLWRIRRRIIHRNLHGVDLNGNAVRLCALRLWLALAVDLEEPDLDRIPPLPNLDHKVKQGDSLLSPLDLLPAGAAGALRERTRRELQTLSTLKDRYERASGTKKRRTASALRSREAAIALKLIGWRKEVLSEKLQEFDGLERSLDLFGKTRQLSPGQRRQQETLSKRRSRLLDLQDRIEKDGELPFFCYEAHFAEIIASGGFDLLIGNPPWVRLQRIPDDSRPLLRSRYSVFRQAAWSHPGAHVRKSAGAGGQVDLSALFVERSLELLRPGGVLSLLLPAKLFGSLYGGGLRKMLQQGSSVLSVEDHRGSGRSAFKADTFPLCLTARAEPPDTAASLDVAVHGSQGTSMTSRLAQVDLPLFPRDPASPWLLAPGPVRQALRRMAGAGECLGRTHRPAMGRKTGSNRIFVVESCSPASRKDRVRIWTEGFRRPQDGRRRSLYSAVVEREGVRPLIRGEGLEPWSISCRKGLLAGSPDQSLPLQRRFLHRHGEQALLWARSSSFPQAKKGCESQAGGTFVVWKDIALRMSAAVAGGPLSGPAGMGFPVPLNTTNLIETATQATAHGLAALLNSTPARAFLSAICPEAKDGYLRFPCWAVALLPLPALDWSRGDGDRLVRLSRKLHALGKEDGGIRSELDRIAARVFDLDEERLQALTSWMEFVTTS